MWAIRCSVKRALNRLSLTLDALKTSVTEDEMLAICMFGCFFSLCTSLYQVS